jgi:hypothetical protein
MNAVGREPLPILLNLHRTKGLKEETMLLCSRLKALIVCQVFSERPLVLLIHIKASQFLQREIRYQSIPSTDSFHVRIMDNHQLSCLAQLHIEFGPSYVFFYAGQEGR